MSQWKAELTDALHETLALNGSLGEIKARMRAEIFKAVNDGSDAPLRPKLSNANLLINELIIEYLAYNRYNHALSVLLPESGQPEHRIEREFLSEQLHIPQNEHSSRLPLLYSVLALLQHSSPTTDTASSCVLPLQSLLPQQSREGTRAFPSAFPSRSPASSSSSSSAAATVSASAAAAAAAASTSRSFLPSSSYPVAAPSSAAAAEAVDLPVSSSSFSFSSLTTPLGASASRTGMTTVGSAPSSVSSPSALSWSSTTPASVSASSSTSMVPSFSPSIVPPSSAYSATSSHQRVQQPRRTEFLRDGTSSQADPQPFSYVSSGPR